MKRIFIIEDDATDDEEPAQNVHYKVILHEDFDYETEDDVEGYPTSRDFAQVDWESRRHVRPWDPHESNFFPI